MTEYVIVHAMPVNSGLTDVLLILKNRPTWQAEHYNLVGGKIEKGETPLDAAVRELKEEAGLKPLLEPTQLGKIVGSWGVVHCVRISLWKEEPKPRTEETEQVGWHNWLKMRNSPLVMPNLKVIVPLMASNSKGWVISDECPHFFSKDYYRHTFAVTIECGEQS